MPWPLACEKATPDVLAAVALRRTNLANPVVCSILEPPHNAASRAATAVHLAARAVRDLRSLVEADIGDLDGEHVGNLLKDVRGAVWRVEFAARRVDGLENLAETLSCEDPTRRLRHPAEVIVFVRDEVRKAHVRDRDRALRVLLSRHAHAVVERLGVAKFYAEHGLDLSFLKPQFFRGRRIEEEEDLVELTVAPDRNLLLNATGTERDELLRLGPQAQLFLKFAQPAPERLLPAPQVPGRGDVETPWPGVFCRRAPLDEQIRFAVRAEDPAVKAPVPETPAVSFALPHDLAGRSPKPVENIEQLVHAV
jgi:hypothetical protein